METQKTPNSQSNLKKEKWSCGMWLPDFRLYYKAMVFKTVWSWHKHRVNNHCNKIANPIMNPHNYSHIIHDKGGKNVQWRKDSLFNKWCWENWTATSKRMIRILPNTIHKNKPEMD